MIPDAGSIDGIINAFSSVIQLGLVSGSVVDVNDTGWLGGTVGGRPLLARSAGSSRVIAGNLNSLAVVASVDGLAPIVLGPLVRRGLLEWCCLSVEPSR